jgi:hypothetical protein
MVCNFYMIAASISRALSTNQSELIFSTNHIARILHDLRAVWQIVRQIAARSRASARAIAAWSRAYRVGRLTHLTPHRAIDNTRVIIHFGLGIDVLVLTFWARIEK